MNTQVYRLYELNNIVRGVLEDAMDDVYWVQGELYEGRAGLGGHFYGELVEKDERTSQIIARARINIWARNYNILSLRFQQETGQTLKTGMKLLLKVKVTFHEQYGYALNVLDIDSTYTMGDMARKRMEILRQLEADGIINDNKTLPLPLLPKHIAVISSPTAAGYGDFCNQLQNNEYGFHFDIRLYPAVMQGEQVEESIIRALERALGMGEVIDLIVIIRGGGASADLSDFDSYPLASCIAQCPIPIIVGIGHERDETVLDHVAHTSVKTPTAAAAFIIDRMCDVAMHLDDLQQRITNTATQRLTKEKQRLERYSMLIPLTFAGVRQKEQHRQEMIEQRIRNAWASRFDREKYIQEMLSQRLKGLDPTLLLKRGYSIVKIGNKIVTNSKDLNPGEVMTTQFQDGDVLSTVICKNN